MHTSSYIAHSVNQMDPPNPVIPRDWVHLVRTKTNNGVKNTKRKAATIDQRRTKAQKTNHTIDMPPESMHDACNNILSAIHRANGQSIDNVILHLDPILSNVAYKDLVENLFGMDSNCVAPVIPVVTKAYEESFMREVIDSKVDFHPVCAH
jgi:hypothetical protein